MVIDAVETEDERRMGRKRIKNTCKIRYMDFAGVFLWEMIMFKMEEDF